MIVGGVEYVTATEATQRLGPDVTAEVQRNWRRRGLVRPAVDPAGRPIKILTATGWQYVVRWSDLVDAEYATRTSRVGSKRAA